MLEKNGKVRVTAIDSVHNGKVGTVKESYLIDGVTKVCVHLDGGGVLQTFKDSGVEKLKRFF